MKNCFLYFLVLRLLRTIQLLSSFSKLVYCHGNKALPKDYLLHNGQASSNSILLIFTYFAHIQLHLDLHGEYGFSS